MKQNKLTRWVTFAFAALAMPLAALAFANGDIVEIRAVDVADSMVYGGRTGDPNLLCSVDNPLRAGDDLYIRVRMLVRNYEDVIQDRSGASLPLDWEFMHLSGSSYLNRPALGLYVGNHAAYAELAETGPYPWQVSGRVTSDETGSYNTQWQYYTDFYFHYTVKAGDIGLPVRLMYSNGTVASPTDDGTSYYLLNVNGFGSPRWVLQDAEGHVANFWYGPETSTLPVEPDWPTGGTPEPVRTFDLAAEGIFVKTVDFDAFNAEQEAYKEGDIWRNVYIGSSDLPGLQPALTINGGSALTNATTVWVWTTNDVVRPIGNGAVRIDDKGVTGWALPVAINPGADRVTFSLMGGTSAREGDETDIFLGPDKSDIYTPAGDLVTTAVKRRLRVVKAPPPYVTVLINGESSPEAMKPRLTDYDRASGTVSVKLSRAYDGDVTVALVPTLPTAPEKNWKDYARLWVYETGGIANSTNFVTFTKEEMNDPENPVLTKTLNLYLLGSDDTTANIPGGIVFKAEVQGEAKIFYNGVFRDGTLRIAKTQPVVTLPAYEQVFTDAEGGMPYNFALEIQDTYKNIMDEKGYEIVFKRNDISGVTNETIVCADTENGRWTFNVDGELEQNGGFFTVQYDQGGDFTSLISVVGPDGAKSIYEGYTGGGNKGAPTKVTVVVAPPAEVTAIREKEGNLYEGDIVPVRFTISNTAKREMYAFLKPDAKTTALVSGEGVLIPYIEDDGTTNYYTTSEARFSVNSSETDAEGKIYVRLKDGTDPELGGVLLKFTVVLCSTPEYDETRLIPGYTSSSFSFHVRNVEPTLKEITDSTGTIVDFTDPDTLTLPAVCKGAPQIYEITDLEEPGIIDRDSIHTKWTVESFDGTGKKVSGYSFTTNFYGDVSADSNMLHCAFQTVGHAEITVQLQDKDMTKLGATKYKFIVPVIDAPFITLTEDKAMFNEQGDISGSISLKISEPQIDPLTVRVTVSPFADSADPGRFALNPANLAKDETGAVIPNTYDVTIPANSEMAELAISDLDGTLGSQRNGFKIDIAVLTKDKHPGSGVPYSEYVRCQAGRVHVINEMPVVTGLKESNEPLGDEKVDRTFQAQLGENPDQALNFAVTFDADADVEHGFKVTIVNTGRGAGIIGKIDGVEYTGPVMITDDATHTFVPSFGSIGAQQITITIEDKDANASAGDNNVMVFKRTWYYNVAPSKTLELTANGPGGYNTAFSKRYAAQEITYGEFGGGPGEGHVYSDYANGSSKGFISEYNCGVATSVKYWGFGYKVGAVDNGTLDNGMDLAIDPHGNSTQKEPFYEYSDKKFDSFLYGWLYITTVDGATTAQLSGNGISPEIIGKVETGVALLPETEESSGDDKEKPKPYPPTVYEAIFSKEYRMADNCGDMNADGIPDLSLVQYGLGVVNKDTGAVDGNDLGNVAAYNEDQDFLPATPSATLRAPGPQETWEEKKQPFTAILEIRGMDPGLNIVGRSDLDMGEDEIRAFKRYLVKTGQTEYTGKFGTDEEMSALAAAYSNRIWTAECPTDPTLEDTDGDTLPDGYEYYFWYSARVYGATGEKFGFWNGNLAKPTVIPSETIEELFNPKSARGGIEQGDDTDGDGLTDYEEYVLGTNPVHWDSDGDGVPDGLEVMRGTDPLKGESGKEANTDGDYMAMQDLSGWLVVNVSNELWACENPAPVNAGESFYTITTNAPAGGWLLCLEGDGSVPQYVVETDPRSPTVADKDQVLADIPAFRVYTTKAVVEGKEVTSYWKGAKATIPAGLQLTTVNADGTDPIYTWKDNATIDADHQVYLPKLAVATLKEKGGELVIDSNVVTNIPGMKRVYRYGKNGPYAIKMRCAVDNSPAAKKAKMEIKGTTTDWKGDFNPEALANGLYEIEPTASVRYMHAQVFAKNGFDPRTGWGRCEHGYCGARWCTACGGAEHAGMSGWATNTVAYANKDEFLVMQYRYENGICDINEDLAKVQSKEKSLTSIFSARTTNPCGAGNEDENTGNTENKSPNHGADSDGDSIADGWELYVLKNPNSPSDSPDAPSDDDADLLPLSSEFRATDVLLHYADCESIVGDTKWIWLNKFFPTNPYCDDTDGDGLTDSEEMAIKFDVDDYRHNQYSNSDPLVQPTSFLYGKNAGTGEDELYGYPDDNGSRCIRGGGLNPCSVDTDFDRLPDLWEWQFAGVYVKSADKQQEAGGYIDGGMDGTDPYDAYTGKRGSSPRPEGIDPRTGTYRYFDFDYDGLENYQEYLTQALRHFRYDVASIGTTDEDGNDIPPIKGLMTGQPLYEVTMAGVNDFIHGPAKREAAKPADDLSRRGFFGTAPHAWDPFNIAPDNVAAKNLNVDMNRVMLTPGSTYMIGSFSEAEVPFGYMPANQYASTDPRRRDSDDDGMDDFYEIYHGLNPLLGDEIDVVANAYALKGKATKLITFGVAPINCYRNVISDPTDSDELGAMMSKPLPMDFVKYPWLAGMGLADPDCDGLRNNVEMIESNTATPQPYNTDPTPLWMTDTSFAKSYTAQYYHMPLSIGSYWDRGHGALDGAISIETDDWMFSFEMNEGYDTDNDGIPDGLEVTKVVSNASDPQVFTNPRRRQALYFPGPQNGKTSLAISYQPGVPTYTVGTKNLSGADIFRQFTVECWIRPDPASLTGVNTILERVTKYPQSNVINSGEEQQWYVRANFRIGLQDGHPFGLFDSSDARESGENIGAGTAKVVSDCQLDANWWYHVALVYDGLNLTIIVNKKGDVDRVGIRNATGSTLIPANGVYEILQEVEPSQRFPYYYYATYDSVFAMGGSVKLGGITLCDKENTAANYDSHYVGYVGEVRVWDGARKFDDVIADFDRSYTQEELIDIRNDVYDSWAQGGTRSATDGTPVLPPELVQQYTFDGLHGATEPQYVATAPNAFTKNVSAVYGETFPIECGWLAGLDDSLKSSVYTDYAYIPWVKNAVAHLPILDGGVADSVFWAQELAGKYASGEMGLSKYAFPRTGNPYTFAFNFRDLTLRSQRYEYLAGFATDGSASENSVAESLNKLYRFDMRTRTSSTSDLVPLGGAFAKRCEEFWDNEGATPADPLTSDPLARKEDDNGNGLPDWWEEYARENYVPQLEPGASLNPDTLVKYDGRTMTAAQAYLIDLAKGLLPPKEGEELKYYKEYAETADSDKDGMYDWWEELYGVQGNSVADCNQDPDNDGLSNYQEFLVSMGNSPYGFMELDPNDAHSGMDGQKVPDYYLPFLDKDKDKRNYIGFKMTDHDFMEDWWENKYAKTFADASVYDPWKDADGDGWSNYAECRSFLWRGAYSADRIDRYLDGHDENHVNCFPQPAIGVKVSYCNNQIQNVRGKDLIVRTMTAGKRTDATFVLSGNELNISTHYVGGSFGENTVLRGHLNPGCIQVINLTLKKATLASEGRYRWSYDAYNNHDDYNIRWRDLVLSYNDSAWRGTGSYSEYRSEWRKYPLIELLSSEIAWDSFGHIVSDNEGKIGQIVHADSSTAIGTLDFTTGEYALDLGLVAGVVGDVSDLVFEFEYQYRLHENWPQTVWLSEPDSGRVMEGLNTIEAFIDIYENGQYDVGEPYGVIKNVQVGWHKVPAVTIELTDDSRVVARTAIGGGDSGDSGDGAKDDDKGGVTTSKRVSVVRTAMLDRDSLVPKYVKERTLMTKEFVMDDRTYLTEADVITTKNPDLDWKWLCRDAQKNDIADLAGVRYEIRADGLTVGMFDRKFGTVAPVATAVAPIQGQLVNSSAPTFQFSAGDDATAFALQIADESGTIIYESGVKPLGGRVPTGVEQYAYEFKAPIYADAAIVTNGAPVLLDNTNYQWRVAVMNAKFTPLVWPREWATFRMAVAETNLQVSTGYGTVKAVVRYFGSRAEEVKDGEIVVEAFENADFTGQALSQTRASVIQLSDATDLLMTNAFLKGIAAGTVYIRAYIDQNNNGKWDKFESWGYLNDVGSGHKAIYNPIGVAIGASASDLKNPKTVIVYIEDTDLNQNGIPDCEEGEWLFPVEGEDADDAEEFVTWWDWAEAEEDAPHYVVAGDVMAYAEVDRWLVRVGLEGDSNADDWTDYLLAKGAKVIPGVGDDAMSYDFVSCYEYLTPTNSAIKGLGIPVELEANSALKVKEVKLVKVALIHNQVYQEFGYNWRTANADEFIKGTAVNTKPFTAIDKKMLPRYFEAIGYAPSLSEEMSLDLYLDSIAKEHPDVATAYWNAYSLKVGDPDNNRDGVADGWNLYVMFGPDGSEAECTPWTEVAASRGTTSGGDGLAWYQEYDNGHYPTDPWSKYTSWNGVDFDTYTTDEGVFTISDKDAYDWHLKGNDKYLDHDNDGLINYTEFVVSKNGDRTLNVDNKFSYFGSETVPALAGQIVPDYFLKSTKSATRNGSDYFYYLGFKNTAHDFTESWWKDQYGLDRKSFALGDDDDADGWSNWSEARAGTDPMVESQLSLVSIGAGEDNVLPQYPIPAVGVTVTVDSDEAATAGIVLRAWKGGTLDGMPEAEWKIAGSGEATTSHTRFLGLNPNKVVHLNLGPGSIAQGTVNIEIFDPHYQVEKQKFDTNGVYKSSEWELPHQVHSSKWAEYCYTDNPLSADSDYGILPGQGYVNYRTGEAAIDFTAIQRPDVMIKTSDSAGGESETEKVYEHYDERWAFVRVRWSSRLVTAGRMKSVTISTPDESDGTLGHLTEGEHTFIAFADQNGNGEYDLGEPFGVVKGVDVGWDKVADLKMSLTAKSPVLPRFNPAGGATTNDESNVVMVGTNQAPLIVDAEGYTRIRVVRTAINGIPSYKRIAVDKTVKADSVKPITEADVLFEGNYDLDWNFLERDANLIDIKLGDVKTVQYAVYSGTPDSQLEAGNLIGAFEKTFTTAHAVPVALSPTAGKSAKVTATHPTFVFKAPVDYPAFAFQLFDETNGLVYSAVEFANARDADGNITYQPALYFGAAEENRAAGVLSGGFYVWRVALLNAKYRTPEEKDWSTPVAFTADIPHGKVMDTDKGILAVTVRYYGEAPIDENHPIVVEAFKTADFTGIPAGRTVVTNDTYLGCHTNLLVNAVIFGLEPGDYYVRAYVDTENDFAHASWESWGYQNNVGTDRVDLYTPVATTVEKNKTSEALVFMEDMDENNNDYPDCLESHGHRSDVDADGDGLADWQETYIFGTDPFVWDTDGDGMPDGWEALFAKTDPLTADADFAVKDDVMAYLEVTGVDFFALETQGNGILRFGDKSHGYRYYLSYNYGDENATEISLYGRGQEITEDDALAAMKELLPIGATVDEAFDKYGEKVTVALVHDQVLDYVAQTEIKGFDRTTAVPGGAYTKPFTALDKYLLIRYRVANGLYPNGFYELPDGYVAANPYIDPIEDYVNVDGKWEDWTLKPGETDCDKDGIADGWELYVQANPWNVFDRYTDNDGDGLRLFEEWDNGNPTDPWADFTIADDLHDADAYRFHLKTAESQLADYDNDGLSNWAEYLAKEAGYGDFDADDAYSVSRAAGGDFVLDYFVKVVGGDCDGWYVGEALDAAGTHLIADHDFMEDWWEDQYDVSVDNRYVYNPYADKDGDGWSNYAELRAGTDPTKTATAGIENLSLSEYPVPLIKLTVQSAPISIGDHPIVALAYNRDKVSEIPDATWNTLGATKQEEKSEDVKLPVAGGEEKEEESSSTTYRYVGVWRANPIEANLAPGSVTPGSVKVMFKDMTFDNTPAGDYKIFLDDVTPTEAIWVNLVSDQADVNDPTKGKLYERHTGTYCGTIDYVTGQVVLELGAMADDVDLYTEEMSLSTTGVGSRTEQIYKQTIHPHKAYVKVEYASAVPEQSYPATFYLTDANDASEATGGHIREGHNDFVVFADLNDNGQYDAGEPADVVRDVCVGWQGTEISVELADTAVTFPSFTIEPGSMTSNDYGRVRIMRTAINDHECNRIVWQSRLNTEQTFFSEADYIKDEIGEYDFDWATLVGDAKFMEIPNTSITSATYQVYVGTEPYGEPFVKNFLKSRTIPVPFSPTADRDNKLLTAQPTFIWRDQADLTAFVLQLSESETFPADKTLTVTNFLPATTTRGREYKPEWFIGNELKDNTTYYWRVAELSAKWPTVEGGWSEVASFVTADDSARANTGYGKMDVEVRYYGPSPKTLDDVVVELHKSADFLDPAVARQRIGGGDGVSTLAKTTTTVKDFLEATATVTFDGIAPGSYYAIAYIDVNGDNRRQSYETWGYVCKVGTFADKFPQADLWTPVATDVISTKGEIPSGLIIMEDTDVNQNMIPDCLEDMHDYPWIWPWPEPPTKPQDPEDPNDPHPWQEDFNVNPDDWIPGDYMAAADLDGVMYVKLAEPGHEEAGVWYVVMDPSGEGVLLRGAQEIPNGTKASDIEWLATWWDMYDMSTNRIVRIDPSKYDGRYNGLGTNVAFGADSKLRVVDTMYTGLRLLHGQVYAQYGYDPAISTGESEYSAPMTARDKYMVCRYLENIGVKGVSEAEMLKEAAEARKKGLDPRTVWLKYTLDPTRVDGDRDGIRDPWELFVMFGVQNLKHFAEPADKVAIPLDDAKISPFNPNDAQAIAPGDGSQLKLVEEFDGNHFPTDPWKVDTDDDGIADYYAYQYCLKGGDAGEDFDKDGLSNYSEYLISEVFQYANPKIDPRNPKSDGYCIDYFRKMGDLYLGEIFQDHDQVDDAWEAKYNVWVRDNDYKYANRYVYDPDRDDDEDGWSNYAESRAGTDPTKITELMINEYTYPQYPVPTIEAAVVYNGKKVLVDNLVFKAWNEERDPDMTGVPDAIWTIGGRGTSSNEGTTGTSGESTDSFTERVKFLGKNPCEKRTILLPGGAVKEGSITLEFLDTSFVSNDIYGNGVSNGVSTTSDDASSNNVNKAVWYTVVKDRDGKLYRANDAKNSAAVEVGTVNYATGMVEIDFASKNLGGIFVGGKEQAKKDDSGYDHGTLDRVNLTNSYVRATYSYKRVGYEVYGTHYLGDADPVTSAALSHGHLREGKTTFMCYVSSTGEYTPGDPFGVVRGVDVGWDGARLTVELSEMNAISPRIDIWNGGTDDRRVTLDDVNDSMLSDRTLEQHVGQGLQGDQREAAMAWWREWLNNRVEKVEKPNVDQSARIRVVRYGIDDKFCYLCGVYKADDTYRGFSQQVVMDKDFNKNYRNFLCEADFLGEGEFDIDWNTLSGTDFKNNAVVDKYGVPLGDDREGRERGPKAAVSSISNMTYLVVIGEGAKDFRGSEDTNTTVRALATIVTRRFENTRSKPVTMGSPDMVHAARPTFKWAMPDEEPYAKEFGSSYTAFRLQILGEDGKTVVYDSGVHHAPPQEKVNGTNSWAWTARAYAGDQTSLGKVFGKAGNWKWRVAMYNAKFKPLPDDEEKWSNIASFSTSVDQQQAIDDHNYFSIDVNVKYMGPSLVIANGARLDDTTGKIRVQAFRNADFTGDPMAQGVVTDVQSLSNPVDLTANGRLVGLPAGTYHIRAYIDSNGNFKKDDWESWGYAKTPVTVSANGTEQIVGLYIEDADTDHDWLPDAWEYAKYGNLSVQGANVDPEGRIVLKTATFTSVMNGKANISKTLSGSSLTFFQNLGNAGLLLGLGDVTYETIAAIRAKVERNIDPNSVKIRGFVVDPNAGTVTLTVGAYAADSIAGSVLSPVYVLPTVDTVVIKVYKKDSLVTEKWTEIERKTVSVPASAVIDEEFTVKLDSNLKNGFFKVEVLPAN